MEEGPSEDVFSDAKHPYTRALAAAFPAIGDLRFRRAPSGPAGGPPYPSDLPAGCTFHPRCPEAFERCPTIDPRLYDVSARRRAACLLVEGALATEGAPAPDRGQA